MCEASGFDVWQPLQAPDIAWFFYNRGLAFSGQGDAAQARRDFDRARKLDPMLAPVIENRRNSAPASSSPLR